MSIELTEIEASQVKPTDSLGKVEQEHERSALSSTGPPSAHGWAREAHAQPQQLAEATSPPEANALPPGDTLANLSASEIVHSPPNDADAQNDATHKPSSSLPRSFSLHRLWTTASSIGDSVQPASWLGVTWDHEDSGGKRTWVVKITKFGLWLVVLHLLLAAAGIFNLVTTIYSWTSGKDTDDTLQRILKNMADSETYLHGLDEKLINWLDEAKNRSVAEEARVREEQHLWDALIKVFKDCAESQGRDNGTDACDNIRQYFDHNPLPRPDNSPIAKRNIAKLDQVIKRQHLHAAPGGTLLERFGHGSRQPLIAIVLVVLFTSALVFLLSFLLLRKWRPKLLQRLRIKAKREDDDADEKAADAPDPTDHTVPIFATGGDFIVPQSSLIHRGQRKFDAHAAAARGALDELKVHFEVDQQWDVNKVDEANEYGPLLAAAARSGSEPTVKYVLSRKPNLSLKGGRYHSVLQAAAHSANHQVVELLLAAGAREASAGGFYSTAVNAASEKGNAVMLMSLLKNNPNARTDVNHPGGTYGYPLIAAAARGDYTSVEVLLEHGAQVNQPNESGTIALHRAVANGHLNVMELLIKKSSAVNQISTVFGTPLHAACRGLHTEAAKILLERGADPSIKDQRLRIPLHEAAEAKGGLDQVIREILRTRPELVDEVDVDSNTALQLASMAGNTDVVRVLLDYHANCTIGDKFNAQPLFRAAGCGHADIVELLLEVGHADPNATDCFGRAALHGPAQTTDVRVHELLISKNADVNIVGNDKKTALHEACNMGRIKNVELLLECEDIKINELDNDRFPPLYKALCSSDANKDYFDKCVDPEIVKMLLKRDDIDVNASNGIAVQEAARKGFYGFVEKMLTERNANIQIQGGKYGGVLQAAAISGDLQLVNLLLKPEYHADVNLQGGEFGCPLAAAAAFGHVHIVRRLLEAGANPCATGVGRYGSPLQSICQKVDAVLKARDGYKWGSIAAQIHNLLEEYGGPEVSSKVERRYEGWRWLLLTTGWGWAPPGEM